MEKPNEYNVDPAESLDLCFRRARMDIVVGAAVSALAQNKVVVKRVRFGGAAVQVDEPRIQGVVSWDRQ